MEEGYDFNSSVLIAFELQEGGAGKELPALRRQKAGYIYELIVVNSLSVVFWKGYMFFE